MVVHFVLVFICSNVGTRNEVVCILFVVFMCLSKMYPIFGQNSHMEMYCINWKYLFLYYLWFCVDLLKTFLHQCFFVVVLVVYVMYLEDFLHC